MSSENQSSKPDLYVYVVDESKEKKYFTRIGAAFSHSNGGGFSIELSAHPIDRRMVLFPPKEESSELPENTEN